MHNIDSLADEGWDRRNEKPPDSDKQQIPTNKQFRRVTKNVQPHENGDVTTMN